MWIELATKIAELISELLVAKSISNSQPQIHLVSQKGLTYKLQNSGGGEVRKQIFLPSRMPCLSLPLGIQAFLYILL